MDRPVAQQLFSFGTLQQQEVQTAVFGRLLHGVRDALSGYRLTTVKIADPEVVRISGSDEHPMLQATGDPDHEVLGTVFELTDDELRAADDYEDDSYVRASVVLASGTECWVYLPVAEAPGVRAEAAGV